MPQSSFDDAISVAALELDSVLQGGDVDELRKSVRQKVKHCKENGSFTKLYASPLSSFLDLCRDPYFALTNLTEDCTFFEKDQILKAVSYSGPFGKDVLDVLKRISPKYFRRTRKYELLKAFHDVGNMDSANWYAGLNRENWKDKELLELVEGMGLQPFPIGAELLRRGMAAKALPYALASGDDKTAIGSSIEMLKPKEAAEKNIARVLSAWKEGKPSMNKLLQSPRALLNLFTTDPKFLSCDEMTALLINFGPGVTAFLKICVSMGNIDEELLESFTCHHLKLRECIKSRKNHDDTTSSNMNVMKKTGGSQSTPHQAVSVNGKPQNGKNRTKKKKRKNGKKR